MTPLMPSLQVHHEHTFNFEECQLTCEHRVRAGEDDYTLLVTSPDGKQTFRAHYFGWTRAELAVIVDDTIASVDERDTESVDDHEASYATNGAGGVENDAAEAHHRNTVHTSALISSSIQRGGVVSVFRLPEHEARAKLESGAEIPVFRSMMAPLVADYANNAFALEPDRERMSKRARLLRAPPCMTPRFRVVLPFSGAPVCKADRDIESVHVV